MAVANVQILHKRGNATVSAGYTGPVGEITIDTTSDSIRIHDGSTAGGLLLPNAAQSSSNVAVANVGMRGYVDNAVQANLDTLIGTAAGGLDSLC